MVAFSLMKEAQEGSTLLQQAQYTVMKPRWFVITASANKNHVMPPANAARFQAVLQRSWRPIWRTHSKALHERSLALFCFSVSLTIHCIGLKQLLFSESFTTVPCNFNVFCLPYSLSVCTLAFHISVKTDAAVSFLRFEAASLLCLSKHYNPQVCGSSLQGTLLYFSSVTAWYSSRDWLVSSVELTLLSSSCWHYFQ